MDYSVRVSFLILDNGVQLVVGDHWIIFVTTNKNKFSSADMRTSIDSLRNLMSP